MGLTEVERQVIAMRRIALATDCPKCGGTGLVPGPPRLYTHSRTVAEPIGYFALCDCGVLCEPERAKFGGVYGGNDHPMLLLQANGWAAWVDQGIADDIKLLWSKGIPTWVSCQGDENASRYIGILDYSRVDEVVELLPWVRAVYSDDWRPNVGSVYEMTEFGFVVRREHGLPPVPAPPQNTTPRLLTPGVSDD